MDKLGERCPSFVFAGPNFETLRQDYADKKQYKKLIFLGTVSDELLVSLYKYALALVYPSVYEGLGLPILEAMAAGTPVITSNCSSMPEVAGCAAVLIDPHKVAQLTEAMMRVVQDKSERERLKKLGLHRAREFSWGKAAHMTLDIYENILEREC